MKRVYIVAGEVLTNMGDNIQELMDSLENNEISIKKSPYKYKQSLERRELQGVDSYSAILLHPISMLLKRIEWHNLPEYVGTIFASEFGPMNSNLNVLRTLYNQGAEFVSPKKFAGTVPNTCLGHICIKYKFRDISTMFVGSSPLPYSFRVLALGKVRSLIMGNVDEFNEDFFQDFKNHKTYRFGGAEGANVLYLINEDIKHEYDPKDLVEILSVVNAVGGDIPYEADRISINSDMVTRCIKKAIEKAGVKKEEIDEIYMISNADPELQETEEEAIDGLFDNGRKIMINKDSNTGLLVASGTNLVLAAERLKQEKHSKIVIVNGLTACGQWISSVLRSEK